MKQILLILIGLFLVNFGFSQSDDPVLFTVEGNPVHVSEFNYIYTKNNGDKANYSEKSLREYLDLYSKFKLKVQRARELKLDTIVSLQKELEGYRKQLANSYLVDNEVSEQLIKEVFERKKYDVRISHILVSAGEKASDKAIATAKEKMKKVQQALASGTPFEEVAKAMSDDKQSVSRGGDIGFVTSMLPQGFYELETAVYNTPVGQTSDVVKSTFGYHIVKVMEKRPARGEMEISHILIRKKYKGQEVPEARAKVDSLYQALQSGSNFDELAKVYSQDTKTNKKSGYLGFFGINKYEIAFEDAAFNLKKDGDVSKPLETKVGYHILKRISKKNLTDYKTAQKQLKRVVSKSGRFDIARAALIQDIKTDGGFKENKKVFDAFSASLTKDFFSYKWKVPTLKDDVLVSFSNGQKATIIDFANYCKKEAKTRLRYNKKSKPQEAAMSLYNSFIDGEAIKYEESNLENKYPEFKSLMREYREGILLFEATEREVWNKASLDTVGLKTYFEQNKTDYRWEERAKVIEYVAATTNAKEFKKVFKAAKKKNAKDLASQFNKDIPMLSYKELILDKKSEKLSKLKKWKVGQVSKPSTDIKNKQSTFYKVIEILPPGQKELSEARGYVISDFQDSLEKAWIKNLSEKYEVVLNEDVFKSLIK